MAKNPTIKRIMKEAAELATQPSADYTAAPLEGDIFEWHFTLRGPPTPSLFAGGLYHGRIVLPPAYPLKPPSFRFLTPTGRFEVNREICLSISGHHEESWQPAWGIRTALVALRSFMDTSASGQLGGMEASEGVRRRMAGESAGWRCAMCGGKSNGEIMGEQEEVVREVGGEGVKEVVPEELRLGFREDLGKVEGSGSGSGDAGGAPRAEGQDPQPPPAAPSQSADSRQAASQRSMASQPARSVAQPHVQVQRRQEQPEEAIPAWIDKAIYGIIAALIFLVWRRWMS